MLLVNDVMNKNLMGQVNSLMVNCVSQGEMFDYLINIGLKRDDATLMAKSFDATKKTYSVIPIYYFAASKASGMKQDFNGKFYK
jgi:hypothetical protein